MTRRLALLMSCWVLFTAVLPAQSPPGTALADVVTLVSGAGVSCRILETTASHLRIEYLPPGGVGRLVRDVPWADVKSVDFAMDEEFRTLLEGKKPAASLARLHARWGEVQPLLGRPHHPAGELGLALVRTCLAGGDPAQLSRALEVCELVAAADWNETRRSRALLAKAEVFLARKEAAPAVQELARLLENESLEPAVAAQAWLLLGQTHFASLKAVEEEHPRWQDDDMVLPERQRLFHEAVESFVRPSLFAGGLEAPAASGLWLAVAVLLHDRDVPAAADTARDLIQLYPASPQASEARQWLEKQKLPLKPVAEPAPPAPAPEKAAAPAETKVPEPDVTRRKRYDKPAGETKAPPSMP